MKQISLSSISAGVAVPARSLAFSSAVSVGTVSAAWSASGGVIVGGEVIELVEVARETAAGWNGFEVEERLESKALRLDIVYY
jgi:hypothetical protein